MSNIFNVPKWGIIEGTTGVYNTAKKIFDIVEATYVRRTTYERDVAALVSKIDLLEDFIDYNLRLENGHLKITLQDGETMPTVSINNSGHLILTTEGTTDVDKFLSKFTFSVNSNGELVGSYT